MRVTILHTNPNFKSSCTYLDVNPGKSYAGYPACLSALPIRTFACVRTYGTAGWNGLLHSGSGGGTCVSVGKNLPRPRDSTYVPYTHMRRGGYICYVLVRT